MGTNKKADEVWLHKVSSADQIFLRRLHIRPQSVQAPRQQQADTSQKLHLVFAFCPKYLGEHRFGALLAFLTLHFLQTEIKICFVTGATATWFRI